MKVLFDGRAVLMGKEEINLGDFPALEVIGVNMTGTDHLPWAQITEKGVKVFSLKGETEFLNSVSSTSEHTIGLMLALARNYKRALNAPYSDRDSYTGYKIKGKIFGGIGFGRIGRQVEKIAREGFGMTTMFADVYTGEYLTETVLKESDFLSLHIPLEGNEGFFTLGMFRKMKDTAYFINTSRPGIVQKGALLEALQNQYIAGAAVDFIDDPELLEFSKIYDRLILTPHCGGNTFEDRKLTEDFILAKINNYFSKNV